MRALIAALNEAPEAAEPEAEGKFTRDEMAYALLVRAEGVILDHPGKIDTLARFIGHDKKLLIAAGVNRSSAVAAGRRSMVAWEDAGDDAPLELVHALLTLARDLTVGNIAMEIDKSIHHLKVNYVFAKAISHRILVAMNREFAAAKLPAAHY